MTASQKHKHSGGRPTKLTHAIRERITQALRLGNYRQDAAVYAGIDPATLRRWLARGRKEQAGPYYELFQAVVEAEAKAKISALGAITQAARDGDWRAAAWLLQRKFPHQFAENSQLFGLWKVIEQLQQVAESVDTKLPEELWERLLSNVAHNALPLLPGVAMPAWLQDPDHADVPAELGLTEEERVLLLKVVRASHPTTPSPNPSSPNPE